MFCLSAVFLCSCSGSNEVLQEGTNLDPTNSLMSSGTTFSDQTTTANRDVPIVKSKEDVLALHLDE